MIEPTTPPVDVATSLRRWARGVYPLEAGVELLIKAFPDGRLLNGPWLKADRDRSVYWLDQEALADNNLGGHSGGERRILAIARSLIGGEPVSLYEAIPGLDDVRVEAVLGAIRHASGQRPDDYNNEGQLARARFAGD